MLAKLSRKLKKISRSLAIWGGISARFITKSDYQTWEQKAQQGEFQFHIHDQWRRTDDFMNQTIRLLDHFGFRRQDYQNKTVIDLGAGSRLRSKYFVGANLIAIEPLADRFVQEIGWCDLSDADAVYSVPAEKRITECFGVADLVMSINVLDHCYDFEAIIENIASYLKKDGCAFLSFDKHEVADEMHPLQLDEGVCQEIFLKHELWIQEFTKGADGILMTYGHGPYCLNYRLKKHN